MTPSPVLRVLPALAALFFLAGCHTPGPSRPAGTPAEVTSAPTAEAAAPQPPAAAEPVVPPPRVVFDDEVVLDNGVVRIAVSPQAGRITHFGRSDAGPAGNLLWLPGQDVWQNPFRGDGRSYFNLGGDKVWVCVQALWERAHGSDWPPEGVIDGRPWNLVEASPERIVIESEASPAFGARVRREIELVPGAATALITNRLTRTEPNVFPLHIWSITQVNTPPMALLDVAPDRVNPSTVWLPMQPGGRTVGPYVSVLPRYEAVAFQTEALPDAGKIGALGRWVAAVWEDHLLLQIGDYDRDGSYPDGSSAQIYTDDQYTELELLSDSRHLRPGETMTNRVAWHLLPRPAAANERELVEQIETYIKANPLPRTSTR